jgi:carbon-monoxide dehydrogenase medium subunit
MSFPSFLYSRPLSLREALDQLAEPGSIPYAGGTDLLIELRRGKDGVVKRLVDLKGIGDLRFVSEEGDFLRIGSLLTLRELIEGPLIRRYAPALALAASVMGSMQIRNRGSLTLCRPRPTTSHPRQQGTASLGGW